MTADTPPDADDEPTSDRAAVATDGDLAERERALRDREEPYARATVVRREPPVSANVGDRALVTADGELHGWIGGAACAQSRVASEAQAAIDEGEPRLIGLAPDPDDVDRPGLAAFPMMCHSEGTLEIFVEPMIAATRLLVVGDSPIARSLVRLATELDVEIAVVDPDATAADLPDGTTVLSTLEPDEIADAVGAGPFVVVTSMGEYDARGVAAGVLADAPYVGLVASDSRAEEVVERAAALLDRDPDDVREAITNPAGVDISATTGPEIATSLLAELVDVRADSETIVASWNGSSTDSGGETTDAGEAGTTGGMAETADSTEADGTDDSVSADEQATDPVCGMTVDPADSASVTHDGTTYYFCCHGCADSFQSDPDEYLTTDEEAMESV